MRQVLEPDDYRSSNKLDSVYKPLFDKHLAADLPPTRAAIAVAHHYLDGKPRLHGKRKLTSSNRDEMFWTCDFLGELPATAWHEEAMILALARYFGQTRIGNMALLEHLARAAPETVRRAVRYSGLVLRQDTPRMAEITRLAELWPPAFGEFVRVLRIFDEAYRQRTALVERHKQPLDELTPLEFLIHASLYAFEFLIPQDVLSTDPPADPDFQTQSVWDAINDLLLWKLATTADEDELRLTERSIGQSLRVHLSPFLFPSGEGPAPRDDLQQAFRGLLAAQIELNSFISRSANAFSHDHAIDFVLQEDRLELVVRDPGSQEAWERHGEQLTRLHRYWFYRGIEHFVASDMAMAAIGSPENHEANRLAYIRVLGVHLRLTEVYGLDETVTTESGLPVNVFQALLASELMGAFFQTAFIEPYCRNLQETGDPHGALGRLAFAGLLQPESHNRFPITWSDRKAKIANLVGWTVNRHQPKGSRKAAEAILDFWTSDWIALARQLRRGTGNPSPTLFERPVIKMGPYLFQLPWVVAMQNNAVAAINNLRRLGSRRPGARNETQRIETRLARCFQNRGFRVQLNYQPARTALEDPGEVDLICARDGDVLVLEVKSTFLRLSFRDAWLHGTTTLRKAGLQLQRKAAAVHHALGTDAELAETLGIESGRTPPSPHAWIVDTSIEWNHGRFSGFLKISLEELLIALRDDAHLLNDPGRLFSGNWMKEKHGVEEDLAPSSTLYPDGFSFSRLVEVIENQTVWHELPPPESYPHRRDPPGPR